ncbi:MAG: helix-turn-helix transcriptional regulator, partial [Actinobacteria bacterium]|nr:helix-turn-helix transcriptional regulator [Actinomycetota bacterium]
VKLSAREQQVAALVAEGLTNREIGSRLSISERTVEGHVVHLLDKLGYRRRLQIAVWARHDARLRVELSAPPKGAPLDDSLRCDVERTRQEIAAMRSRLEADGDQPQMTYALGSHCLRILESALRGEVTAKEVYEFLAAGDELAKARERRGDYRYAAERARWWPVFQRLALALTIEASSDGEGLKPAAPEAPPHSG